MTYTWVQSPSALLHKSLLLPAHGFMPLRRQRTLSFVVPRRSPERIIPNRAVGQRMSTADENLNLQLVTVPDENHMLTPGEVRQVALDYFLFHSILQTGSTLFGCVRVFDSPVLEVTKLRGSLLSILSVKNVVPNQVPEGDKEDASPAPPKIMVECKCSGRFDVKQILDETTGSPAAPPQPWKLMQANCVAIHDLSCWDYVDRRKLAALEWEAWEGCCEVASLMRKLSPPVRNKPIVEQELAVWAPAEYDRKIDEGDWEQTPPATRHVWYQRAEAFSFGVLRCMESDEDMMRRARETTSTAARLELALESMEKRRAMTQAQLSLKNALN